MLDKVAGQRRAAFFLALPSLVVLIGIGFVPLALVAIWSLWSFDPDTYWIKPVWSLASYAALLKSGRAAVLLQTAGLAALTATASTLLAVPAATVSLLQPKKAVRSVDRGWISPLTRFRPTAISATVLVRWAEGRF